MDAAEAWAEAVDAVAVVADLERLRCEGYITMLVWKRRRRRRLAVARVAIVDTFRGGGHTSQRSQWALGVLECLFNVIKEDYKRRQRIANNTWELHLQTRETIL